MSLPSIAIVNFSDLDDQTVQDVIRAVNRQVLEDFTPLWGCGRVCRLHAAAFDPMDVDSLDEEPVQADGVIYLVNESTLPGALGYHDMNAREVPIGFVFTELAPHDWTVTLSHEVLELIVDPSVNIFLPGPDPRQPDDPTRWLFHSYEVCDAVERSAYRIDGVLLSNFVTPSYFREGDAIGTRNDFLGVGVTSFGLTSGSHLGVWNPSTGEWETILGTAGLPGNMAQLARRQQQYEYEKPVRPSDDCLYTALSSYQTKPPKGCSGLERLLGVTRASRYKALAERRLPSKKEAMSLA